MSMPSSVFIARKADIDAHLAETGPFSIATRLDCGGVDPLKIATLATICTGASLDDVDAVVARCPAVAAEAGPDGPWVFALSPDTVNRLAALDPQARDATARTWAHTEEWSLSDEELPDFQDFFRELCNLAKQAATSGRAHEVWVWHSL